MKLLYSKASPFVRKCIVVAREAGLIDQIELVDVAAHPIQKSEEVYAKNPLGKIPALVLDDGRVLFDSRVICEYFESLPGASQSLFSSVDDGPMARMDMLVLQALGDGMMDAAVAGRYEMAARPEDKQWPEWVEALLGKVTSALNALEKMDETQLSQINVGTISINCALAYLDFRHPGLNWRDGRPKLKELHESFSARESMMLTQPDG